MGEIYSVFFPSYRRVNVAVMQNLLILTCNRWGGVGPLLTKESKDTRWQAQLLQTESKLSWCWFWGHSFKRVNCTSTSPWCNWGVGSTESAQIRRTYACGSSSGSRSNELLFEPRPAGVLRLCKCAVIRSSAKAISQRHLGTGVGYLSKIYWAWTLSGYPFWSTSPFRRWKVIERVKSLAGIFDSWYILLTSILQFNRTHTIIFQLCLVFVWDWWLQCLFTGHEEWLSCLWQHRVATICYALQCRRMFFLCAESAGRMSLKVPDLFCHSREAALRRWPRGAKLPASSCCWQ